MRCGCAGVRYECALVELPVPAGPHSAHEVPWHPEWKTISSYILKWKEKREWLNVTLGVVPQRGGTDGRLTVRPSVKVRPRSFLDLTGTFSPREIRGLVCRPSQFSIPFFLLAALTAYNWALRGLAPTVSFTLAVTTHQLRWTTHFEQF
jgi:hypothetical protein